MRKCQTLESSGNPASLPKNRKKDGDGKPLLGDHIAAIHLYVMLLIPFLFMIHDDHLNSYWNNFVAILCFVRIAIENGMLFLELSKVSGPVIRLLVHMSPSGSCDNRSVGNYLIICKQKFLYRAMRATRGKDWAVKR